MMNHTTTTQPATTVVSVLRGQISAPPATVFPLCCPVEEYKWIPGWKCHLVYCPNDKVEFGTVFREIFSAPFLLGKASGETTWTAVLHEPENYRLHFRLDNAHSSSLYKIELQDDGSGGTSSMLEFTYRALDDAGNALAEKALQAKIEIMLELISLMLKTYCETGRMISSLDLQKAVSAERGLSLREKVHLAMNRLAMLRMRDQDRARFMRQFRDDRRPERN
jgi:hypothetical protein